MAQSGNQNRIRLLRKIALLLALVLFARVLILILYQYQFYFPANFEADFLVTRRETFYGFYSIAFYLHIISGPIALVLGLLLMFSGGRKRFGSVHRWMGKTQVVLIVAFLCPGGLYMATQALEGPISGWGFASLSIVTACSALMAAHYARTRRFKLHQRWATRCFIFLCSPLLLRLMSGAATVLEIESPWAYRLTAWISWLLPIVVYEYWWRRPQDRKMRVSNSSDDRTVPEF